MLHRLAILFFAVFACAVFGLPAFSEETPSDATAEDSIITTPDEPPVPTAPTTFSDSTAATGNQTNKTAHFTGAQSMQKGTIKDPVLQGGENGTIGPQGANATVVPGINSAGTVRVNNLANLEALTNIIANGMIVLGIAWGGPTIIMGFMSMSAGQQDALKRIIWGICSVTGGMACPGVINWLVASGRDAGLFQ